MKVRLCDGNACGLKFKPGMHRYSCRDCDFDLCGQCAGAAPSPRTVIRTMTLPNSPESDGIHAGGSVMNTEEAVPVPVSDDNRTDASDTGAISSSASDAVTDDDTSRAATPPMEIDQALADNLTQIETIVGLKLPAPLEETYLLIPDELTEFLLHDQQLTNQLADLSDEHKEQDQLIDRYLSELNSLTTTVTSRRQQTELELAALHERSDKLDSVHATVLEAQIYDELALRSLEGETTRMKGNFNARIESTRAPLELQKANEARALALPARLRSLQKDSTELDQANRERVAECRKDVCVNRFKPMLDGFLAQRREETTMDLKRIEDETQTQCAPAPTPLLPCSLRLAASW